MLQDAAVLRFAEADDCDEYSLLEGAQRVGHVAYIVGILAALSRYITLRHCRAKKRYSCGRSVGRRRRVIAQAGSRVSIFILRPIVPNDSRSLHLPCAYGYSRYAKSAASESRFDPPATVETAAAVLKRQSLPVKVPVELQEKHAYPAPTVGWVVSAPFLMRRLNSRH